MVMDEAVVGRGYERVGRIIVAWGLLDRALIAETWRTKTPVGRWPDRVAAGFGRRCAEWGKLHKADQALLDHLRALSTKRDDMAHNVVSVEAANGSASVVVMRLETDWRRKFDRWARYLHLRAAARPAPPKDREYLHYSEAELIRLEGEISAARERVQGMSQAYRSMLS